MSYPWLDERPPARDPGRVRWPDEEPALAPRRPPGRRVEVLRRIDPWSALKVSLLLYFAVFLVALALAVALWLAGRELGMIGGLEGLIEDLGLYQEGTYHFKDGEILRMVAVAGPLLVVLASLATVAGVGLFNLVARMTGGVEVTVGDEDRRRRRPRY